MAGAELRVVTGPTAAGKSAIALALAERHGASIVSADSRQVYRQFDIGTAKPSAAERARVPHFGVDVAEPTERYSAARWAAAAEQWIAEVEENGGRALVVGGTGFYLRALFAPLFDEPALEPERRRALQEWLATLPLRELRRWCETLDPRRAALGRSQLLRAIEVSLLSGQRLSDLHDRPVRAPLHRARYLVVDPGPALAGRIERRVDEMFASGWIDEVRRLVEQVPADAPAWNAAGYEAVREHVRGEISAASARERVVIETRQYAKRQRTWMRHQLDPALVTRLDPTDPDSMEQAERWWNARSG